MSRRVSLCAGLVAAGLLAGAVPADAAASLDGPRWPGRRITYFDASKHWRFAVGRAAAEWNASGMRMRFVRTWSRASADVVVVSMPLPRGIAGRADLGYYPYAQRRVELQPPWRVNADRFEMTHVAAHELGHVLGLGHSSRRCALMSGGGGWCFSAPAGMWRCRVLQRQDVWRAVRMYGGTVRPLRSPANCFRYPLPKPPTGVTAEVDPGARLARVSWRNPSGPGASQILIARSASTCPRLGDAAGQRVALLTRSAGELRRRGTQQTFVDRSLAAAGPGTYCYTIWSGDESGPGRFNRRGVSVTVEYTPPAPPANDALAEAEDVHALPLSVALGVTAATLEPDEPLPSCAPETTSSVWYRVSLPEETVLHLDTSGSDYDTVVAVYDASLAEIACHDDVSSEDKTSELTVALGAGEEVLVQVTPFSDEPGDLVLEMTAS